MSIRILLALLPALLLLGACGGSAEDKQEESLDLMEEAIGIMKTMKDAESVKAGQAKLAKVQEKLKEIGKELEGMPKADLEAAAKKHGDRIRDVTTKYLAEIGRVAQLGMSGGLKDLMKGLGGK